MFMFRGNILIVKCNMYVLVWCPSAISHAYLSSVVSI